MATLFSGQRVGTWSGYALNGTLTGNVARSGNTVTLSSLSLALTAANAWGTDNNVWFRILYNGAELSRATGLTMNSGSGSKSLPNASFTVAATATSATLSLNSSDGYTVNFTVSFSGGVSMPANPGISLLESTNSSMKFRFTETNWGGQAGRWEWWFSTSSTPSGVVDANYNWTPGNVLSNPQVIQWTWDTSVDVTKSSLNSNKLYYTHLRVYNQQYSTNILTNSWYTKPQDPSDVTITIKNPSPNYLPFPFSSRASQGRGITYTDNGDGTITMNGVNDNSGISKFYLFSETTAGDPPVVLEPGTYHFSPPPHNSVGFNIYDGTSYKNVNGPNWSFTITERTTYKMMSIDVGKGNTHVFDNDTFAPKLLDDSGDVVVRKASWTQWSGDTALDERCYYYLAKGDIATFNGQESDWVLARTIPSGGAGASYTNEVTLPSNLDYGSEYTVFVKTSNYAANMNGSGDSSIKRAVFMVDFPEDPILTFRWNDTRDRLLINLKKNPNTDSAQVAYSYIPTNYTIISGIDGDANQDGSVDYPEHGNNQRIYLYVRSIVNGNVSQWSNVKAIVPVPNPIIGVAIMPDGKKHMIIDVVEKKSDDTVTPKWRTGQRIVRKNG